MDNERISTVKELDNFAIQLMLVHNTCDKLKQHLSDSKTINNVDVSMFVSAFDTLINSTCYIHKYKDTDKGELCGRMNNLTTTLMQFYQRRNEPEPIFLREGSHETILDIRELCVDYADLVMLQIKDLIYYLDRMVPDLGYMRLIDNYNLPSYSTDKKIKKIHI